MNQNPSIQPFLKWAGGKRWLIHAYSHIFDTDFHRYIEPFLGGGAIFFHLQPSQAILSDSNSDLIDTYSAIKSNWQAVWKILRLHQNRHSIKYYYEVRDKRPTTLEERAARFIYLNRTCWNGLYRVNKQGEFNVPKGTKHTVIFEDDDFETISKLLQNAKLINNDFESVIKKARKGDLIYVDPPYTVKHDNNNFIKYNEKIFSWEDQIRLSKALHQASASGAKIIVSNADYRGIRRLYSDFCNIEKIGRYSTLAADSSKRRRASELIMTNYEPQKKSGSGLD